MVSQPSRKENQWRDNSASVGCKDTEYLNGRMEEDSQNDSIELVEKVDKGTMPEWVEDSTMPPSFKRRIFHNSMAVSPLGIPAVSGPDGAQYKTRGL